MKKLLVRLAGAAAVLKLAERRVPVALIVVNPPVQQAAQQAGVMVGTMTQVTADPAVVERRLGMGKNGRLHLSDEFGALSQVMDVVLQG